MRTFPKYKQNLKADDKFIYSYDTKVARFNHADKTITKLEWNVDGKTSSPTTSKHINYVASEYGYFVINYFALNQAK